MEDKLVELIEAIKSGKKRLPRSEAETKQGIILPALSHLGWDIFNSDEVHPEYSVEEKSVDFALKHGEQPKVFLEAKKASANLEPHEEQLLEYSFREGVRLAVLTNGAKWWFYLPVSESPWTQRRFFAVDVHEQDVNEAKERLVDFLSRHNVLSGKALENAERHHRTHLQDRSIRNALPQAWNSLIGDPDVGLIDLISARTEEHCGYRPSSETVERFIADSLHGITQPQARRPPDGKIRPKKTPRKAEGRARRKYSGKSVSWFGLKGVKHEAHSWRDMLLQICDLMAREQRDQFNRVLTLRGSKRPYFSRDPDDLRSARRIVGTDIYVEVHLNADRTVRISKDVLSLFGYRKSDLTVRTG